MSRRNKRKGKTPDVSSNSATLIESNGRVAVAVPYEDAGYRRMLDDGQPVEVLEAGNRLFMGIFKREEVTREAYNIPVGEDADQSDWSPTGSDHLMNSSERVELLEKVRWLCTYQPNCFRALKLYENYVLGSGLSVDLVPSDTDDTDDDEVSAADKKIIKQAKKAWKEFLKANRRWWTVNEFGRRIWRDGTQVSRKFPDLWPPRVRFIDPECIADPQGKYANPDKDRKGGSEGIRTAPYDVTKVLSYMEVNPNTGELVREHPADEIIHTVIDCDSTEKWGRSRFTSCVTCTKQFSSSLETEIIARKLQASIVLQKKVSGGQSAVQGITDAARTSTTNYPERSLNREKIRPGTIMNTNRNVELEFLSPNTNIRDATPLMRQILLQLCSATGWAEYMVTGDGSNSNQASAIVQEGPVDKMVRAEQDFMSEELGIVYEWVIEKAIAAKKIKGVTRDEIFERFDVKWTFPETSARNKVDDAHAWNIYHMGGALSSAEGARRAGADPMQQKREIKQELEEMPGLMDTAAMNPSSADKGVSSASNAQGGSGTNQGKGEPIQHKDKQAV